MLEIKSLGIITDEAIAGMHGSEECIVIPIDFNNLCPKLKKEVLMDFVKEYPETHMHIDFTAVMIWVNISIPEKSFTPSLVIEYTENNNPVDCMEWGISFIAKDWNVFIKKVILPFFDSFKEATN